MKADEIEAIVAQLLQERSKKDRVVLDEEFKEFRLSNKMFYETILNGEFNEEIFKQMMAMKRRLEKGEDPYQVDVRFGQFMADKYIPSNLKN